MQRLGSTWEAVCGLPAWGEIFLSFLLPARCEIFCLGFHSDIPHGVRFFRLDFHSDYPQLRLARSNFSLRPEPKKSRGAMPALLLWSLDIFKDSLRFESVQMTPCLRASYGFVLVLAGEPPLKIFTLSSSLTLG